METHNSGDQRQAVLRDLGGHDIYMSFHTQWETLSQGNGLVSYGGGHPTFSSICKHPCAHMFVCVNIHLCVWVHACTHSEKNAKWILCIGFSHLRIFLDYFSKLEAWFVSSSSFNFNSISWWFDSMLMSDCPGFEPPLSLPFLPAMWRLVGNPGFPRPHLCVIPLPSHSGNPRPTIAASLGPVCDPTLPFRKPHPGPYTAFWGGQFQSQVLTQF